MVTERRQVELLEKNRPRQERAKRTYEAILKAAAELLIEVGVERISTNLVAERAGITVPALYRYFPNKYAVLNALGAGLMDRQNDVFAQWFETHLVEDDLAALLDNIDELLKATLAATVEQAGGLEVVQALRAVGPLQEVRLESHRLMGSQFAEIASEILGQPVDEALLCKARLTIDLGYAIVEMALEDETLPTDDILQEGARLIQGYWAGIIAAKAEQSTLGDPSSVIEESLESGENNPGGVSDPE
jgi:AcrR family transcriptional regulator